MKFKLQIVKKLDYSSAKLPFRADLVTIKYCSQIEQESRIATLLMLSAAIILIIFCTISCSKSKEYDENQRRENFNKNFEAFHKLEQMQLEDIHLFSAISIDRVYELTKDKTMTHERLNEYRSLMKRAGLEVIGYVADEPKKRMIRFHEDIHYVNSGYVYMEYPPPRFYNKFSECEPIKPSNSCYIFLRKNWYIFYENYRLKQESV